MIDDVPTSDSDTRQRLIEAAVELLWERSYHAASVDELCTRAQAKKGSFYHFFPSKVDLAIEAIRWAWEDTRRSVFDPMFGRGTAGLAEIERFIEAAGEAQRAMKKSGGHYLGCFFGSLGQELAHQDERLRLTLDEIFNQHCAYFEGALKRAVDTGEIKPCDTAKRARAIFALLEGAFLLAKVANDPAVFSDIASGIVVLARRG